MTITNPTISKVFDDLDEYRDYCRFEGKVFDEAALYNKKDENWQSFLKWQHWNKTKNRSKQRK